MEELVMRDLLASAEFWVAMLAAVVIKLRCSPRVTLMGAIITTVSAVACALVFTVPVMEWLEIKGEHYQAAIAALVALSGEHIARQVLETKLVDLLRAWRGK